MYRPIITLTTDFGYQDYYVSAMKAVILGINPDARLLDISHSIPAQDIMAGAWVLKNAAFMFPEGSIHLAVVDPGVGTARKPIVAEIDGHHFVGPDNGLFSLVASQRNYTAYELTNKAYMAGQISRTFHGRDIFAPVAGHLSTGVSADAFGPVLPEMLRYRWATPIHDSEGIQGWVMHIDGYGNLITNIPASLIEEYEYKTMKIYAGTTIMRDIHAAYGDVPTGEAVSLIGSSGMLEISVNQGRAEELLNVQKGASISVIFKK
ncbi:MAG: SAM hydrolase/SAM-dependent halogenase family protein [Cyclonatronaceae bacterium]